MAEREHFLWVEKYRPQKIDDCILPEHTKQIFKGIVKEGKITNLLLAGGPGQGKTTVARALCNELEAEYLMVNGSEERGIDVLRTKIKSYASSLSVFGGQKVIIVDEADYLTPEAQAAMRGVIEEFAKNCSFIFTCNYKNRIIEALHSRCGVVEFRIAREDKTKLVEAAYRRIAEVLKAEDVKFDPKVLGHIIVQFFPDYRRTINELQKYSKLNGEINEGILTQVHEIDITTLYKGLKEKNFNKVREWVVNNLDNDPSKIYRKIYDGLKGRMEPASIPQAIIYLADYQFKSSFSADQEICLCAFLINLMVDCQWV